MNESMEQSEPSVEVRFDERRQMVVISGATEKVLDIFASLLRLKYPRKVPAEIEYEINEARRHTEGDSYDYEYTFGVMERVYIRRDKFGDYGKQNATVMLYLPNSPPDERERTQTLAAIKANMLKLGYEI